VLILQYESKYVDKFTQHVILLQVKMAEDALKRVTGMSSSQPPRPLHQVPANADASGPILDNIIDYLMSSTDATADNNFVPRTTAPAPLQAEKPTSNGASNSAMLNRIAAHHGAAVELLQKRLGAMPASSDSTSPESVPSGVDESMSVDGY
jgi:hypothetical protein